MWSAKTAQRRKKEIVPKRAVCITLGEQSENHFGMVKNGNGLAEKGFSLEEMKKIESEYEGETEWIDLSFRGECANVLVLRNCADIFTGGRADEMFTELVNLPWDTTYWDVRRAKWLNKHARHNLCFSDTYAELNKEKKSGTVISYNSCPLMHRWKGKMEEMLSVGKLEAEGNYYYNVNKTGIGAHGDSERKKVVAVNLSDHGVKREIRWHWFLRHKPIGNMVQVVLNHGDGYIMSEKASGYDWRRSSIPTLRHSAGSEKYLKFKNCTCVPVVV
jgi:hypothetical protein